MMVVVVGFVRFIGKQNILCAEAIVGVPLIVNKVFAGYMFNFFEV